MTTVRIRQCSKIVKGEEVLLAKFEVVGKCGVVSTHRTYKSAEKEMQEWQKFYDKFGL